MRRCRGRRVCLIGDFAARSSLDVTPDRLVVGFGRIGLTIPRGSVASAEQVDYPPRIRIGWRKNGRRTLSLVAAVSPVVRLRLDPPATLRVLGLSLGVDDLYVSVEDAAGLLAELGRRIVPSERAGCSWCAVADESDGRECAQRAPGMYRSTCRPVICRAGENDLGCGQSRHA